MYVYVSTVLECAHSILKHGEQRERARKLLCKTNMHCEPRLLALRSIIAIVHRAIGWKE